MVEGLGQEVNHAKRIKPMHAKDVNHSINIKGIPYFLMETSILNNSRSDYAFWLF